MILTYERLKELLDYNPDTGVWQWLKPTNSAVEAGFIAGTIASDGYRKIGVGNTYYMSSRLAFFYMTGHWPKGHMDHINRVRSDDRWANLREATVSDNNANRKKQSNNTSGYRGVSWDHWQGKWDVRVNRTHIGWFDSLDDAVIARDQHAQAMQGSFAVLNSSEMHI